MSITLFNRGKRVIVGVYPGKFEKGKLDKRGEPVPLKFAFKPETAMAFDDATATRLQRLYPGEVLSVKDAQKKFEAAEKVEAEAPSYDEDAHKAELDAKLQAAKDSRAAVQDETYKKALAEGFNDDEAREIAGLPFTVKESEPKEEAHEAE